MWFFFLQDVKQILNCEHVEFSILKESVVAFFCPCMTRCSSRNHDAD